MEYSFPQYLLAKQSVDDRALNKDVLNALRAALQPRAACRVLEVGAGIGTMPLRLLRWQALPPRASYTLADSLPENIAFARQWLPRAARENGWQADPLPEGFHLSAPGAALDVRLVQADVFDFVRAAGQSFDVLIAHAFLDLLPLPASLTELFSALLPGGLAWLTVNFDGVSSLEPPLSPALDALIERLYHQSMDARPGGGDSRSGRHLFSHLAQISAEILAAGASDWVLYPPYPAQEAYFLHFILHFFEEALAGNAALAGQDFSGWLAARHAQVERGELVYIAHQMDFLCKK